MPDLIPHTQNVGPRSTPTSSLMVSVDVKYHVYCSTINSFKHRLKQSPGEIKRREVSWTLTKKLAQKRSRTGRWSWA